MTDNVTVAEREAKALALRRDGHTYTEIGQALGVSRQMATRIVQRGLRRIVVEPATDVRKIELDMLGHLQVEALAVLRRRHFLVQAGEVVARTDPDTGRVEELLDDGPVLAAIAAVVRIQQRRAAILGLDEPARAKVDVRAEVEAEVRAELSTVDALDQELRQLDQELAALDPGYLADKQRKDAAARDLAAFRTRWGRPGHRPVADPAAFVADALEVALGQLGLDPDEQEQAEAAVEQLMWARARSR
jgi:hypothetical protein